MSHMRNADPVYWAVEEVFSGYSLVWYGIDDQYLDSEYRKFAHIPKSTLIDWEAEESFIRRDQ